MNKKNKSETGKIILILVCVAIVTSVLTQSAYLLVKYKSIYQIRDFNASFSVESKKLGFSADNNVLNFGIVPRGGSSLKDITLYNDYNETLRVEIYYIGNISDYLSKVDPVYLEPHTSKSVTIVARAGEDYGSYGGIIRIVYLKK